MSKGMPRSIIGIEARVAPSLKTQSPFERWDGDCALRLATLNRFGSTLGYAHRLSPWIRQPPDRYRLPR
jgi:hypothetical protein